MFKYILVLILFIVNAYGNKNWIKLDSHDTSRIIKDEKILKLVRPNSSIERIKNLKEDRNTKATKTTNSSDRELLEFFKQMNNVANQVQTKIKKQKPTIN